MFKITYSTLPVYTPSTTGHAVAFRVTRSTSVIY
jgi:hypothetical protein